MKTVGITGASGFIASHVIDNLLSRGYKVLAMDHTGRSDFPEGVQMFLADVRDANAVVEFAAHVDGIIHLAAQLGTQETINNPLPSAETNILGSLNVFEAANQYNLPVVYAGVGNHFMRLTAGGSYTISKSAAEDYARMFNHYRDGRISVVRPVNAYGPRQSVASPYGSSKVRKVLPSFTCRALLGDDIEVYGDGTQVSDCIHVRDVANVFVTALEYTEHNDPLTDVEVGPINSVTVNDVAELVVNYANSSSRVTHLPMRPGEVPNAVVKANTDSLKPLGIDPTSFISLEDGISETVEWYRKNWLPTYEEQS